LDIGAQFGGKCFCHDVRVVRLPRHGASYPVEIGNSCSADRQVKEITKDGVFLEKLEENVGNFPAFIVVDDKGEDFFKEWLG
jgi:fumarate hydratase class I